MFMLTMGPGMDFCFPDICLTPIIVPVPIPYPNICVTTTSAPAAYNVLVDCMPALNQLSFGLISNGDEPGVLGGVLSHMIMGQAFYILGCFTIFADGLPAQRMTSMTGQNALVMLLNMVGLCIVPSQFNVLALG